MGNESDSLVLKQAARLGELHALLDELKRALDAFHGAGLQAAAGCGLHETTLGEAAVWVEYEYEPASGDGWNEPREQATVSVTGVLINGKLCKAQDVAPHMLEEWAVEVMESLNDDAQAMYVDRCERDMDARASQ